MTELPDTTAIRAYYAKDLGLGWRPAEDAFALCDALDAARAERDQWSGYRGVAQEIERELDTMRFRAEAAEARIAAALTFLDKPRGSGFPYARIAHARRALTGPLGKGTV